MKKLLFLNLIIVTLLVTSLPGCQSPDSQEKPIKTSSEIPTVKETNKITGLPVPEYSPTEPPATTTSALSYQDITLEQAIEIIGQEIPVPVYLPPGYTITSVQLKSTSEILRDWKIELTIDNGTSVAPISISISTFSMGMKIPPGAETVKINDKTAMVSRHEDNIVFNWINDTGWGLSLTGSTSITFEELLKIAESITSPPRQVFQASIVPDEDLLVPRGDSRDLTIHLQSNYSNSMKVSITRDTRTNNLPSGIEITATQTSFVLSPGQSLDVTLNVKVGDEVPSPTWPYQPASDILSTDVPHPPHPITIEPYYHLQFIITYQYSTYDNTRIENRIHLSEILRIDPPSELPQGMVTLQEAEEAAGFPVSILLPGYFPEETNPVPIGYEIGSEEPRVITVFYTDYKVVFSPERGVTEPPAGFEGETAIIRKKTVYIGQNSIDWWIYDIHFSIVSDDIPMDELKLIAESMMLIAPSSGSWLD